MFSRRIPLNQIAFAMLVGVAGGIYIYKPMFQTHRKPTPHEQDIRPGPKAQDVGDQENITKPTASERMN